MNTYPLRLAALLLFSESRTASTVLVVHVGDAGNGAFIANAQVRLPALGRLTRTAWNGEAHFDGLSSGRYRVQVRAIGYAPGDIDMQVTGDSASVMFNLEHAPALIDTVRVTARGWQRGMNEFEERRQTHIGKFITDSMLIEHRAQGLQLLMARMPGLRVSGPGVVWGEGCPVAFFLDGFELRPMPKGRPSPRGLAYDTEILALDPIRLEELAGIEFYSRAETPAKYRPSNGGACKVVLMWTKW